MGKTTTNSTASVSDAVESVISNEIQSIETLQQENLALKEANEEAYKKISELMAQLEEVPELKAQLEEVSEMKARLEDENQYLKSLLETSDKDLEAKVEGAEIVLNPISFEIEGETYSFTDDCPEKLQIDGKVYALSDLLKQEDILMSLVVSENCFIKKN
ncbi:hypothetical protein FCOL_05405 [Flavobacterium columnare ATCC 49512]|uniref:Uncharacterized protein n=1 Tax=Flavobacterium columnare (strain ATCC 49512 / CIP 103533 / TG 44/87) TaxID=1041826 RepID=G8X9F9_FLACA|nr:hypothetical protein [Flavobacterium columnare]AEW85906.1 hypothetical protein FCOL_05405 [Flavobacterium columnare ATCC 49512]